MTIFPVSATSSMAPPPATFPGEDMHEPEMKED